MHCSSAIATSRCKLQRQWRKLSQQKAPVVAETRWAEASKLGVIKTQKFHCYQKLKEEWIASYFE
jgi:hypothetical protein